MKCLEYGKTNAGKPEEFWKNIFFMDETNFNIFGTEGRRFVW